MSAMTSVVKSARVPSSPLVYIAVVIALRVCFVFENTSLQIC
jgi:hypothetical protein